MINDLSDSVKNSSISQFADDAAIWKSGGSLKFLQKKIQEDLDNISKWCLQWGFLISPTKTVCVVFSRKKNVSNIVLKLAKHTLEVVKEIKFLGIIFDSKLTWEKHINYVHTRCLKVLNCMRLLTGTKWGATSHTLRTIYIALIRSKIDYGCEVYNSASHSVKKKLDSIQFQALRICTGVIKGASLSSLQVEMGDPPYEIRRKCLIAKSCLNLNSFDDSHPAKLATNDTFIFDYFSKNVKNNPYSITARETLNLNNCSLDNVYNYRECQFPPWHVFQPVVKDQLHDLISKKDLPHLIKSEANILIDTQYSQYLKIFTDGSKDPINNTSGCGFVVPEFNIKKGFKLPNHTSIFMCELVAIFCSLNWLLDFRPTRAVIFVDSLSALQSIKGSIFKVKSQILYDIYLAYTSLVKTGTEIIFEWIPSHVGIFGNELADEIAKLSLSFSNIDLSIPLYKEDIKTLSRNFIQTMWQKEWDSHEDKLLYSLNKKVSFKIKIPRLARYQETILFQLRTEYIGLNKHLFKIQRSSSPRCSDCNLEENVSHFLLQCKRFSAEREIMMNKLHDLNVKVFTLENLLTGYNFLPIFEFIVASARLKKPIG